MRRALSRVSAGSSRQRPFTGRFGCSSARGGGGQGACCCVACFSSLALLALLLVPCRQPQQCRNRNYGHVRCPLTSRLAVSILCTPLRRRRTCCRREPSTS